MIMPNQRQYLLITQQAYNTIPVTSEFIDCFGVAYNPADEETGEATPIVSPTLSQYLYALGHPGGQVREIDANGIQMVMIPIPWDLVSDQDHSTRFDKKVSAKKSIDPIFSAEGTDWGERWLSESEAKDFISIHNISEQEI
jgi:hypothetical protein